MTGLVLRDLVLRVVLAVVMPLGLIVLALLCGPVVLFGRPEARLQISRGMSRALSGFWDGNGDCTFSAWSYRMVVHGKEWGPPRVALVDFLTRSPGHCRRSYEWHDKHGLFDPGSQQPED